MIRLEDKLISENIFDVQFICNLSKCKGACCIEGDTGAPLLQEELFHINQNIQHITPFMAPEQHADFKARGFWEEDEDGDLVTNCSKDGTCVFAKRNKEGVLQCGIEQSYNAGLSDFKKPISCHLYPIRVSKIGEFTVLNYHKWDICSAACSLGEAHKMPVFRFLKDAITRAFGAPFYEGLEAIYIANKETK